MAELERAQRKGRRVRCQVTGEYGTSFTFYKAPDGHYYKSQEVYENRPVKRKTNSTPRRVKCFVTGEYGTSDTFFKAPDGHYYKTEAIYNQRAHEAEVYNKIMDDIFDILAFDPSMVFPTCITRSLKQLSFYGNETILETFELNKEKIENTMRTKSFNSEYQRASYLMACIKNEINDVYKAKKRRESAEASIQRQETQFQAEDTTDFADVGYAAKSSRDLSFFQDDDDE